ncbi:MAG: hypothetical protein E6590_17280 [Clostridiales bacterium]|uniref:hypothetical protein n=1 Tax=Zhenhengia sp. TaxID=2944208 RepID=UPI0029070F7B|nr:hypothetical protein [Clostridiales bacterium]
MKKKMSVLLMAFIILFTLVGCDMNKQQPYEVYGMNEDIELNGVKGVTGETIFKAYIRPMVGGELLASVLEVVIIASDDERYPLMININPYGCQRISQHNPDIFKNTLDTVQCFKASKGDKYNYLVSKKIANTLYKKDSIKDLIEISNDFIKGEDDEELIEVMYTAPATFNVYLGFKFELIEQSKGILRVE